MFDVWLDRVHGGLTRAVDTGRQLLVPVEFMEAVMERLEELTEVAVSQHAEIAALRERVDGLTRDE